MDFREENDLRILSLSGLIPEQICDTVRFTQYKGGYKISEYCGYVSDFIAQVLEDDSIDGAVFSRSCDSSRVIAGYLADSNKFLYQIPVPARRDSDAVMYFAAGMEQYQKALERHYGIRITNVKERILYVNERNRNICQIYNKLGEEAVYSKYIEEIHKMLKKPLLEQRMGDVSIVRGKCGKDKRVYLVGPFLANHNLAKMIEQSGMEIVGDNLTESKRLFSAPAALTDGNLYVNIAKSILHNRLSPTQNQFDTILSCDLAEIKEKEVDGVIYISQKYCEPYDYLYAAYKKMLDDNHIPVLNVKVTDSTDNGHLESAFEAFADLL